jgi:hypothetical protein
VLKKIVLLEEMDGQKATLLTLIRIGPQCSQEDRHQAAAFPTKISLTLMDLGVQKARKPFE